LVRGKLRAALLIVAVVSIAIALYYPVTRYLQGKALDDEMAKLRRMKAEAVLSAADSEILPGPASTDDAPDGTPGTIADLGLEKSWAGAGEITESEISNGESTGRDKKPDGVSTDRTAETGENHAGATDRMAELGEAVGTKTDRAVGADGATTNTLAKPDEAPTDRMAEPDEASGNTAGQTAAGNDKDATAGETTGRATTADDSIIEKTDRSTKTVGVEADAATDRSEASDSNKETESANGSPTSDSTGNAEADAADSTQAGQQSSEGETIEIHGVGAPVAGGNAGAASGGNEEPGTLANPGTAQDMAEPTEEQTAVGQTIFPGSKATNNDLKAEEDAPRSDAAPALTVGDNVPGFDAAPAASPAPTPAPEPEPTPFVFDEAKILPEYQALYEENHDLVGWLKIGGTMVDYPVLQRVDEEYYLTRDFYGRSNDNGQLILDAQCDPFAPDLNLVVSGHDMLSGKMFGTLQRYASERFGRQHPIIEFDTLFSRGRYRLVAAFQTWDYLKREDGFRYNVDIRYRLELKKYLEELDAVKLYDTGVPVEFGDQLITLSTCSTRTDDGRFVVVARRLREGEQP
jgi:SrtB family sortase